MKVLLIEDDPHVVRTVTTTMNDARIDVVHTDSGLDGVEYARNYGFGLIILDLGLPDTDGTDVITSLRNFRIDTPILVLSGNVSVEDKRRSLDAGADDYLVKPFVRSELVARINAVTRRCCGHASQIIEVGPMRLDLDAREIFLHGTRLDLTNKEYSITELMMMRPGMTLSKEAFINHLYGGRDEPEPKIIDVFICKIRKKIAEANAAHGGDTIVRTVWGRGYKITAEPDQNVV